MSTSASDAASRSNDEWTACLTGSARARDTALSDLRAYLQRGLTAAFRNDPGVAESEIEDWVQEALITVVDRLEQFRGESKLTTWAMRIAINTAYSDLRRAHYQDISLDRIRVPRSIVAERRIASGGADPQRRAQRRAIARALNRLLRQELTPPQRKVFYAVQVQKIPMAEVARRVGLSRGALYKRMHDARKRLKTGLERLGYTYDECAEVFNDE